MYKDININYDLIIMLFLDIRNLKIIYKYIHSNIKKDTIFVIPDVT
jgi:hypothetical protein